MIVMLKYKLWYIIVIDVCLQIIHMETSFISSSISDLLIQF